MSSVFVYEVNNVAAANGLKVHYINIGGADSVLIECNGEVALIDGGYATQALSKENLILRNIIDETPTNFVKFQDKKLGVVKNLKDIKVPNSFDETTTKINDEEVIAWFSPDLNLTICYLLDDSGKKDFYIIGEGKIISIYQVVNIDGKNYVVLSIDEK